MICMFKNRPFLIRDWSEHWLIPKDWAALNRRFADKDLRLCNHLCYVPKICQSSHEDEEADAFVPLFECWWTWALSACQELRPADGPSCQVLGVVTPYPELQRTRRSPDLPSVLHRCCYVCVEARSMAAQVWLIWGPQEAADCHLRLNRLRIWNGSLRDKPTV